jgi:hypothetical protein
VIPRIDCAAAALCRIVLAMTVDYSSGYPSLTKGETVTNPEDPNIAELREAYTEVLPTESSSEKMVRLYSAIEAVLGGSPVYEIRAVDQRQRSEPDVGVVRVIAEDPEAVAVVHSHGQHKMHPHTAADYATHQRPIEGEQRLDSNVAEVGYRWPQAE